MLTMSPGIKIYVYMPAADMRNYAVTVVMRSYAVGDTVAGIAVACICA